MKNRKNKYLIKTAALISAVQFAFLSPMTLASDRSGAGFGSTAATTTTMRSSSANGVSSNGTVGTATTLANGGAPTAGSTSDSPVIGTAATIPGGGQQGVQTQSGMSGAAQGKGNDMSMVMMGVSAGVGVWGFTTYYASCGVGGCSCGTCLAYGIAGVAGVGLSLMNANESSAAQDRSYISMGDVTGTDPRAMDPCFGDPVCKMQKSPEYPKEQLKELEKVGVIIDPKKQTVTLPDGRTLPLSTFANKDSAIKAFGDKGGASADSAAFDKALGDIQAKYEAKAGKTKDKDLKNTAVAGGASGEGSGGYGGAGAEMDAGSAGGGLSGVNGKNGKGSRNVASAAKGAAVKCGDSMCGNANDSLWMMMKRRTGNECKKQNTLSKPEECPMRDEI